MLIGVDVDGVIADFYRSICERYGVCHNTKINAYDTPLITDNFNEIIDDVEFWDGLYVLTEAKEIDFEFDYYVTSLPPNMKESRVKWLSKHGFPNKPVIVTEDKLSKCKELGIEILIDDKPSTIQQFNADPDLHIIQFIAYYCDFEIITEHNATNFKEVKKILNKIKTLK